MAKDPPGYSWADAQDDIELPRYQYETDTEYKTRQSIALLSAQIIRSLQSAVHRWDY